MNRYEQLFHVKRLLGNTSIWNDASIPYDMVIALIMEGERAAVTASLALRDDKATNIDYSSAPRLIALNATNALSLLKNAVTHVQYRVTSDWRYTSLDFSTKEAIRGEGLSFEQTGFPRRWYLDLEQDTSSIGLWPVPYSSIMVPGNVLVSFVTTPSTDDVVHHTGVVDVTHDDATVTGQSTNGWSDYLEASATVPRYFGIMSTAEGLPMRWQAMKTATPTGHVWASYTFELAAVWAGPTTVGTYYVITGTSGLDRYEKDDSAAVHYAAAKLFERSGNVEMAAAQYGMFERAVAQLRQDSGFNDLPDYVRQQAAPVGGGA